MLIRGGAVGSNMSGCWGVFIGIKPALGADGWMGSTIVGSIVIGGAGIGVAIGITVIGTVLGAGG